MRPDWKWDFIIFLTVSIGKMRLLFVFVCCRLLETSPLFALIIISSNTTQDPDGRCFITSLHTSLEVRCFTTGFLVQRTLKKYSLCLEFRFGFRSTLRKQTRNFPVE